ncbi:MAG: DUF2147 domain-containing protein, partial [Porticoccaceae bacterium]|nr:DUF2147 domain-containing protein [Porticoccaceae bacterium]
MRTLFILIMSLWAITGWADPSDDPSGLWDTFDKAGTLQSTVEVSIEEGKLYATILSLHNQPEKNPVCEKCEGDLFGKPVIGMEVINGLSLEKNIWQKGTVFDPQTGGSYKGRVWLEGDALM